MSYVIVKGNRKLHQFHSNDAPVGRKKVWKEDYLGRKDYEWKTVFSTAGMFKYYKTSYSTFNSLEEAQEFLDKCVKEAIEKNRARYEEFLSGSTDKLLKYANTLRIIEDDGVFNRY